MSVKVQCTPLDLSLKFLLKSFWVKKKKISVNISVRSTYNYTKYRLLSLKVKAPTYVHMSDRDVLKFKCTEMHLPAERWTRAPVRFHGDRCEVQRPRVVTRWENTMYSETLALPSHGRYLFPLFFFFLNLFFFKLENDRF